MNDSQKNGHNGSGRIPTSMDLVACAEFQKHLPELLGGESAEISSDPHLQTCENCAALVRDLESIAEAARMLLPVYDPSPDLWSQIQTAIKQEPIGEPDGVTLMDHGETE